MTTPDIIERPHAKFGDIVENGWASEDNPTRIGIFVRAGHRTGRLNSGSYWQITDGKGKFWELSPFGDHRITVRPSPDLAELTRLREENGRLREAIEPFATFAEFLQAETEGFAATDELAISIGEHDLHRFRVADFKATLGLA